MFKPINIYSAGKCSYSVFLELPNLKEIVKEVCGKHIRRIDRFTQLSLIGALRCSQNIVLEKDTGIYMSSAYGSLNNTLDVLKKIFKDGGVPDPLKFVSTVNNAACFFLAKLLGIQANNQFIACDNFALEGCLKFAELDIQLGRIKAALVGVVSEVGMPLNVHRKRYSYNEGVPLKEWSSWLLVAKHIPDKMPLACIVMIEEFIGFDQLEKELDRYISSEETADIAFGPYVLAHDVKKIVAKYACHTISFSAKKTSYECTVGITVCDWLALKSSNKQLVSIDVASGSGCWSFMLFEKRYANSSKLLI